MGGTAGDEIGADLLPRVGRAGRAVARGRRRGPHLPLNEPQGEGVALGADNTVFLAGEGGKKGQPGTFAGAWSVPGRRTGADGPGRSSSPSCSARLSPLERVRRNSTNATCAWCPPPQPVRATEVAELWQEPSDLERREPLLRRRRPGVMPGDSAFIFVARDTSGWSPGFDVRSAEGREWSVKLGPEAQSEVVASRILWAIGFHQPPTYYLERGADRPAERPATAGRFRPDLPGQKVVGDWSWYENPFVGTRAVRWPHRRQSDAQQLGLEDIEQQDLSAGGAGERA